VYLCVCVCVCVCVCLQVRVSRCLWSVQLWPCMQFCVEAHVSISVCIHVSTCVCVGMCESPCGCVSVYLHGFVCECVRELRACTWRIPAEGDQGHFLSWVQTLASQAASFSDSPIRYLATGPL
jgi:hypothetical protein